MNPPRKISWFDKQDVTTFKEKLVAWTANNQPSALLDSNDHRTHGHTWDMLAAAGSLSTLQAQSGNAFELLEQRINENPGWWFGYLGYDLKNELEKLESNQPNPLELADLFFFLPETVVGIRDNRIMVDTTTEDPQTILNEIIQTPKVEEIFQPVNLQPNMTKSAYLDKVEAIRAHIMAGDIYEANLCLALHAENVSLEPAAVFQRLNNLTRAPFAAYLRHQNCHLLCGSPERFLQKKGQTLLAQPIKGTRPRSGETHDDESLRQNLQNAVKDKAEHVMIVDLVRNDLAKVAETGSVEVTELMHVYAFRTVFQMISTIKAKLATDYNGFDALRSAFPMGSMTGAPKIRAMEIIEKLENTRRGIFSGALGYFSPEHDFDFNVVIRSIVYQADRKICIVQAGGAIVYDSMAEQEYEECQLKLKAMVDALNQKQT
jgi:para-aminobenzoate synthetase component 1